MGFARELSGKSNHVVAVIGDGAKTTGQAYEAMNNGHLLCGCGNIAYCKVCDNLPPLHKNV